VEEPVLESESSGSGGELQDGLDRAGGSLLRYLPRLLLAAAVLAAFFVLIEGHPSRDIQALENWIQKHPVAGPIGFVVAVVVLTSVFVPDTVFAVAAGVTFGLAWGTVLIAVGALATATVNFFLSRWFLRERIERMLRGRPRLSAIRAAVSREGLKLLVLLRLTPINPVVVSYVMGTTGLRFLPFLAGTLAILPALFVEVYGGYVIKHVATAVGSPDSHSPLQTIVTVAGLLACIAVFVYVTRLARRALAESEEKPS
jgi:uncharacterized membrane protein YdjX (TVP38/TMEM64 family)